MTKLDELKAEYEHRKAYHTQALREFVDARDALKVAADAMEQAGSEMLCELQRLVDEKKGRDHE